MKKIIVLVLSLLFLSQSGYSLEPMKVAFINTTGGNFNVQIKLTAKENILFTGEELTNVSANGSGVVIIDVQDYTGSGTQWADFAASDVTSNHTLDIYVNGTLFSQQRLDQLIKMQSSTSVFNNDGDFNPPTDNSSLGSDDNRWEDAYIGSNTLHVGPDGGMTGGTEMTLSYDSGEGQIAVDGTNALTATTTGVTIPGTLVITALPGTGNRNIGVDIDGNVVINNSPNISAGNGLTIDVSNDLDVGGSATIIANSDNLEVNSSATANQVLLSGGTVGSAATFGAVPLGNSNSVSGTLTVTNGGTGALSLGSGNFLQGNGTNAVTATKAVPTGTVVGTTDTQTLTNKTISSTNNTITIDAVDVTTGTFPDGRIASSNVTQHEGDLTIGNLIDAPTGDVVGTNDSQTLTNKTIDSDNNTITNIENADIKAAAGIDATKLADGTVTNSELQFINSLTSNVQTQLDGKQPNLPDSTGKSGQFLKTEDGNLKWESVSGGGGSGAFTSASGVTKANTNTDDFLFGTNTLDYNGTGSETKLFFDKSKGALRAGKIDNTNWNTDSIGDNSFASGFRTKAKGINSIAMGFGSRAEGGNSIALGNGTLASGDISFAAGSNTVASSGASTAFGSQTLASGQVSTAMGENTIASGDVSTATGYSTSATGISSTAMGSETFASGDHSTAMGNNTIAKSFSETVVGSFNTDYTPNDSADFDINDRAFVVGNGTSSGPRSDALIIYKSGDADINGNLKVQDDVTLSNLAGTGTRSIGVDTDGKIVEVAGGGGLAVTKLEYTGGDILISGTTYIDIPNITLALDANSTYMVKGILGVDRVGSSPQITVKLGYSGTIDLCMLTIATVNCSITNESNTYPLTAVDKIAVDAILKTTTAGTYQLQVKKSGGGDSNITSNTRFVLIKVQ